jgi:hypothetical protein
MKQAEAGQRTGIETVFQDGLVIDVLVKQPENKCNSQDFPCEMEEYNKNYYTRSEQ